MNLISCASCASCVPFLSLRLQRDRNISLHTTRAVLIDDRRELPAVDGAPHRLINEGGSTLCFDRVNLALFVDPCLYMYEHRRAAHGVLICRRNDWVDLDLQASQRELG